MLKFAVVLLILGHIYCKDPPLSAKTYALGTLRIDNACDKSVLHCKSCEAEKPKICQTCDIKYRKNSAVDPPVCVRCTTGCLKCSEDTCIQCEDGWFENKESEKGDDDSCKKCDPNCKSCSTSKATCTSCNKWYTVDQDSDKCVFGFTFVVIFGIVIAIIFIVLLVLGMITCLLEKPNAEEKARRKRKKERRLKRKLLAKEDKYNVSVSEASYTGDDLLTTHKQTNDHSLGSIITRDSSDKKSSNHHSRR